MSGFDEGNVHWSDQGLSESQGSNAQVSLAIEAERLCPQMRRKSHCESVCRVPRRAIVGRGGGGEQI